MRPTRQAPTLTLPLPRRIAEVAARIRPQERRNLGLWLDRFVSLDASTWELKGDLRRDALDAFAREWTSPATVEALDRRVGGRETPSEPFRVENGRWHLRFELRQCGPMVVDLGRAHVLETSMSFDRALGVPRIPGSALKGAARARSEAEGGEADRLFGDLERAGRVAFLDALPAGGRFTLAVDVLTPHFGAYYRGESPPADWLEPVPTTFLVVVGTTFVFDLDGPDRDAVREAGRLLQEALVEQGIGAKSASGYGWFGDVG